MFRRGKSIEAERRTGVTRGGGRGHGNYCLRGQSFGWGGWESSQGGWRWWLYSGHVLHITEACSWKWLKWSILGCIYFITTNDLAQEDVLKEIILETWTMRRHQVRLFLVQLRARACAKTLWGELPAVSWDLWEGQDSWGWDGWDREAWGEVGTDQAGWKTSMYL